MEFLKKYKYYINFIKLTIYILINIYIVSKLDLIFKDYKNFKQYEIQSDWLNKIIEWINLIYNTDHICDLKLKIIILYIIFLLIGIYVLYKNVKIFTLYLLIITKQIQFYYIKFIINKENIEIPLLDINLKYILDIDEKIMLFFSKIDFRLSEKDINNIIEILNNLSDKKEILQFYNIWINHYESIRAIDYSIYLEKITISVIFTSLIIILPIILYLKNIAWYTTTTHNLINTESTLVNSNYNTIRNINHDYMHIHQDLVNLNNRIQELHTTNNNGLQALENRLNIINEATQLLL